MNKKALIDVLLEDINAAIANFESRIEELKGTSDLDETETRDPEDYSQQAESTDMQLRLKMQVDQLKHDQSLLQNYISVDKDLVQPGAVLETDDKYFLVGVSSTGLSYNDKDIICFSTDAPIYAQVEGKKKGDKFKMGDDTYTILDIA